MSDFLRALALAIAPPVATKIVEHWLESRAQPATVQPSEPAPSFAAYVRRHHG